MNNTYYPPIEDYYPSAEPGAHLKKAFSSGIFLTLCVLMTAMVALSMLSYGGEIEISTGAFHIAWGSFEFFEGDILTLLLVIGMWMTYSSACGLKPMQIGGIKIIKVVLTITIIIECITFGCLILAGIAVSVIGVFVSPDLFLPQVYEILNQFGQGEVIPYIEKAVPLFPLIFIFIGLAIMLVAVVIIIIDILFYHNLLHFSKSLINISIDPTAIPHGAKASSIWLLVMALMGLPSAIGSFSPTIFGAATISSNLIKCIVMILSYVFIKKFFVEPYEGKVAS